jgi:hypothetical protein
MQADFPVNRLICGGLGAMRYGFSLARLGYFRDDWAIFHNVKACLSVETSSLMMFSSIGLGVAARKHSDSYGQ